MATGRTRRRPKIRLATLTAVCACVLMAPGRISRGAPEADPWQIRSEGPAGERLRLTVIAPEPLRDPGPGGASLSYQGRASDRLPGAPDMNGLVRTIPGRPGFHALLRGVESVSHDKPDVTLRAAESIRRIYTGDNESRSEKVREPDPAIFATDAFWPPVLMRLDEAWMGTNKLVRVVCWPAQYNPVRRVLRLHTRIVGEVLFVRDEEAGQVPK